MGVSRISEVKGLYARNGWYYFQPPTPCKGGVRPPPVALRTKDYLTAVVAASEERDTTQAMFAAKRMTLEEILPRYYREKGDHTKATRHARVSILDGFKDLLGNPRVDQIDGDMMQRWWEYLGRQGGSLKGRGALAPASKKTYVITVRAFLNWAIAEKLLKGDPLKRLRSQTRVKSTRIQEFLTEDERELILAAAEDQPDYLQLILHLGFFAGLRDAEMLAMKKEWLWIAPEGDRGTLAVQGTAIKFKNGTNGTWQPKGKRTRVVPLHPRLLAFLQGYGLREPFMLAPHKPLWPNDETHSRRFDAKKLLAAVGVKVGVRKLNYHILRHSFATHLAMKGVALAQIAGLLGDGLKVTEDHYAGFCPNKVNPLAVL